jgi:hypothetical protein
MKPTSSQADLTLLVQQEGQIDQEVFLQHGITIGRAASNMICIEDPEVEHIHARVLRQTDGSFILQAEDRATFQIVPSEDGSTQTTDKAALQADLILQIGKTKITCLKQKTHASAILAESLWEAACPKCQSVISDQSQTEQTCSSCSLPLFHHKSKEFTGWLPRKVGPYEIRKFVAKGGMGVVLRGIHPNLVRLQASGREESLMWLAMDWVEGESLSGKIGRGLGVEEVRSLMEQAVKGLGVLHGKGIMHRDLKPSNLLVGADGLVKLADFGLAKTVEGEESILTATGTLAGTGPYMAPEQWQGLDLSSATDVYAMGIIWHELLTGKRPQLGKVKVEAVGEGCPESWIRSIKGCLQQDPEERPGLRELQETLREEVGPGIIEEAVEIPPVTSTVRDVGVSSKKSWEKAQEEPEPDSDDTEELQSEESSEPTEHEADNTAEILDQAVPGKPGRRIMPWAAVLVLGVVVGLAYWMSKGAIAAITVAVLIILWEEITADQ